MTCEQFRKFVCSNLEERTNAEIAATFLHPKKCAACLKFFRDGVAWARSTASPEQLAAGNARGDAISERVWNDPENQEMLRKRLK